jgi:N-glycosylase/DNA lyase
MEFQLNIASSPLDVDYTLDCGQVFRWQLSDGWWLGVVKGYVLKIKRLDDLLIVKTSSDNADEQFTRRYLRLDDSLPKILSEIRQDELIGNAVSRLNGLRLIRQDPWECTASFICATYKNIHAIQQMISNLSRRLGEPINFENTTCYSFPTAEAIAKADKELIKNCGLGYRADFLIKTARNIVSGDIVLQDLLKMSYETAQSILLSEHSKGVNKLLPGVGLKVADCILLFSLEHLEAFPIDVWIRRAVFRFYLHLFNEVEVSKMISNVKQNRSIGPAEYRQVSEVMRKHFGTYAGYAQEYLYHYTRVYEPLLLSRNL